MAHTKKKKKDLEKLKLKKKKRETKQQKPPLMRNKNHFITQPLQRKCSKALFMRLSTRIGDATSSPLRVVLVRTSAELLMRSESVWWPWCWCSSIWPVDLGAVCVIFGLWPCSKVEGVEVSAWVCVCVCACRLRSVQPPGPWTAATETHAAQT